jgi:hypothetical protein
MLFLSENSEFIRFLKHIEQSGTLLSSAIVILRTLLPPLQN